VTPSSSPSSPPSPSPISLFDANSLMMLRVNYNPIFLDGLASPIVVDGKLVCGTQWRLLISAMWCAEMLASSRTIRQSVAIPANSLQTCTLSQSASLHEGWMSLSQDGSTLMFGCYAGMRA
jgi:hypothetical protein